LQNKLAMTYMAGANPMEGISLLRKIVEKDAENAEALLNLGILAIQTNQYDRAEEHLSKLVKYHPEHWQGHLLLGTAMLEHGHKEEARQHFEIVKNKGDDPALIEAAGNYLKKIK
jgi:Flp pilus assembly protein TadD